MNYFFLWTYYSEQASKMPKKVRRRKYEWLYNRNHVGIQ